MDDLHINLESETIENVYYRRIIYTLPGQQMVLMNLKGGETIEKEMHPNTDQFIRMEKGAIIVFLSSNKNGANKRSHIIENGQSITIPRGTWHFVQNKSILNDAKLYTIYSKPMHEKDELNKI